jgi:hypothetical protein
MVREDGQGKHNPALPLFGDGSPRPELLLGQTCRGTISGAKAGLEGIVADSEAVKARIEELLNEDVYGSDASLQRAWLIAAQNSVQLVFPSDSNPYHARAQYVVKLSQNDLAEAVFDMSALLAKLLEEIEGGLLTGIENHAIAVTFDDFLDHGAEYLRHGRKNEAGVIAGIVFEDTIRRICRVLSMPEKGIALDTLIAELVKQDVLTSLKAKRARAAAGLRTSAAHARWDEIDLSDVAPVIELTKELIEAHLG